MFDLTNRQTFDNVSKWADDVRAERGSDAIIVMVGNKSDKVEERAVTSEEG